MSFIRRGLSRVKNRLKRRFAPPPPAFDRAVFVRGSGALDEALKTISGSFVSSWEICATNLHQALKSSLDEERAAAAVQRFSDALVPALDGISRLHHATRVELEAMAGEGAGAALAARLDVMADETRAGWQKTVDYLDPVLEALRLEDGAKRRLEEIGEELRSILSRRGKCLSEEMGPDGDLTAAADAFARGTGTDLEIALDRVRSVLTEAAWLAGRP